ncbi:hypothetical protein 2 [Hubei tombus-like virus 18]|uniref:hypothetical protein 2 n=1 Tax=Hubei tombus-like virus 18 TaxID=1923264 RepID=UPI000909E786|nr:hypothetical protein 2 [Hubei tombus-like virus 18]APG76334.1 hypothetical protein 2 [Hubei tombus-like virus 18]
MEKTPLETGLGFLSLRTLWRMYKERLFVKEATPVCPGVECIETQVYLWAKAMAQENERLMMQLQSLETLGSYVNEMNTVVNLQNYPIMKRFSEMYGGCSAMKNQQPSLLQVVKSRLGLTSQAQPCQQKLGISIARTKQTSEILYRKPQEISRNFEQTWLACKQGRYHYLRTGLSITGLYAIRMSMRICKLLLCLCRALLVLPYTCVNVLSDLLKDMIQEDYPEWKLMKSLEQLSPTPMYQA